MIKDNVYSISKLNIKLLNIQYPYTTLKQLLEPCM